MIFNQLQEFCKTLYNTLGNARDAVFDLMDAVLVSACIVSFVSLSQSPVFRRQWSSVYAALQDHRLPRAKVLKLLVQQIPTQEQPLLAGDASRWQRPAAKTLKDRTLSGGTDVGITVGQSYSTLAWIPEADGSWALPLRHERITSFETPGSRPNRHSPQAASPKRLPVFWWPLVHPRRRPNHAVKRQDGARATVRLRVLPIRRSKFVPLKPGTYDLCCTIPGHGEAGMVGTLTVL